MSLGEMPGQFKDFSKKLPNNDLQNDFNKCIR